MQRRHLLQALAATAAAATFGGAHAQEPSYPNRPITLVVSSGAGALADQAARLYADRMAAFLRQPFVVENLGGAGGLIATRRVAAARPDGYTLLVAANTLAIQPLLHPKAGYALKDIAAVGEMARSSSMLVTSSASPWRTLPELVAAARQAPGTISYGSSGHGTTNHLLVEMLGHRAGVKFLHVPYKGVATAVPDVVGGRLGFVMPTATSTGELVRNGNLRALAISSAQRSPAFPDVPTLAELGYPDTGFEIWIGLFAPAGLPAPVLARLAQAMEAARADSELVRTLQGAGQEVSAVRTPEQFAGVLAADERKFKTTIQAAGLSAE